MKKVFCVVCILTLLCTMLPASTLAAETATGKYYPGEISLGPKLPSAQLQDCIVDVYNGVQYLYSTSTGGSGAAKFNVVNLDTREVVGAYDLIGTGKVWRHVKDSKGRIYAVGSPKIHRYDPATQEITDLGRYCETESTSFTLCIDEKDNVYIGTYPNAKIIKFDAVTETFEDWGNVREGAQYIRTIAYHKGYLYCGTYGTPPGHMVRVNVSNPADKKVFDAPTYVEYDPAKIGFYYESNVAGDLIINNVQTQYGYSMFAFDTTTQDWVDFGKDINYTGLYTTPPLDGKAYFIQRYGNWMCLDVNTKEVTDIGWKPDTKYSIWGGDWVELKGYPDFPGKTFVTLDLNVAGSSALVFLNFETKKLMVWDDLDLQGSYQNFLCLENMPDGGIFVAGAGASRCYSWHPETGEEAIFESGQVEGSVAYNGKLYIGDYTNARIEVYDPTQPPSADNPYQFTMITGQDRPFAMEAADGKIFGGTIAEYGTRTGAIFIYDLEKQELHEEINLINNQSVMGLAYTDGMLYGSTTIHGGLGSEPTEKEAKIFIYDVEKKQLVKEFVPNIPVHTNPKPTYIGDLEFGPDGKLWGMAGWTLFSIDPYTEKVSDVLSFGDVDFGSEGHAWKPKYIRFDKDGNLYVGAPNLYAVNTKTMKYEKLTDFAVYDYTIAEADNNLYFAKGSNLCVLPILDEKPTFDYLTYSQEYYSDKLVLKLDNSLAASNGKAKYIDESNAKVVPILENDRTLVPIRFIAESLGAEVSWNDATQTATLKKDTTTVSITIGENKMLVNGSEVALDVPAQLRNERTLLPLRAVSDALGKQVFWGGEETGLIVISDEAQQLNDEQIMAVSQYQKFYLKNAVNLEKAKADGLKEYEKVVASIGGKRIEVPNQSFEELDKDGYPVGFEFLEGDGYAPDTMVEMSSYITLDGQQALHINDANEEYGDGYTTGLIEIDPSHQYKLVMPIYSLSGRTCFEVYTYNAAGKPLYKWVKYYTPALTNVWEFPIIDIGMKGNPKYISIRLFNSELWQGDAYYDNITLLEIR